MDAERPIIFSGPMVRAILEGRKTMTRRLFMVRGVMPGTRYPITSAEENVIQIDDSDEWHYLSTGGLSGPYRCPYGVAGDRLWVRETWLPDPPINGWPGDIEWNGCGCPIDGVPSQYRDPKHCLYAATWTGPDLAWRPSIHMPRWASRIDLEITGRRVERLQEISDADALAEGIATYDNGTFGLDDPGCCMGQSASIAFMRLWDCINAKRAPWVSNPWVWVIEFRRIDGR